MSSDEEGKFDCVGSGQRNDICGSWRDELTLTVMVAVKLFGEVSQ